MSWSFTKHLNSEYLCHHFDTNNEILSSGISVAKRGSIIIITIASTYLVFIDIDKEIMSGGVSHGVVKRGAYPIIQCVRALT